MTGYTVHTGTSKQFVSGWDRVFGGQSAKEASKSSDNSAKKKSQKRRKSK